MVGIFLLQYNFGKAYTGGIGGVFEILTFYYLGSVVEISVSRRYCLNSVSYELFTKFNSDDLEPVGQNNRIERAVLTFNWHLLPIEQKKLYLFFLHHIQRSKIIYIAKLRPCNMETSLGVGISNVDLFLIQKQNANCAHLIQALPIRIICIGTVERFLV